MSGTLARMAFTGNRSIVVVRQLSLTEAVIQKNEGQFHRMGRYQVYLQLSLSNGKGKEVDHKHNFHTLHTRTPNASIPPDMSLLSQGSAMAAEQVSLYSLC